MATRYEYYNTNDDNSYGTYGTTWNSQTFTVGADAHTITSIKLKLRRGVTTPGTGTVSIRATSAGLPTGNDLTSATINGNIISTTATWYEYAITEITLAANTKYAIVLRFPSAPSYGVSWASDVSSPTYAGGNDCDSTNSGSSWTAYTTHDFMFEIWGNSLVVTRTKTYTVTALLKKGVSKTFLTDTLVVSRKTTSATFDSRVAIRPTSTIPFNALVKKFGVYQTYVLYSHLKGALRKDFPAEMNLKKYGVSSTFTADTDLIHQYLKNLNVDFRLLKSVLKSFDLSLDLIVGARREVALAISQILKGLPTLPLTVDTDLMKTSPVSYASDLLLLNYQLMKQNIIDIIVKKISSSNLPVDLELAKKNISTALDADLNLLLTTLSSLAASVIMIKQGSGSLSIDVSLFNPLLAQGFHIQAFQIHKAVMDLEIAKQPH